MKKPVLVLTKTGSAESEGFEPPELLHSTVFKTAAIDHSANSPRQKYKLRLDLQTATCFFSGKRAKAFKMSENKFYLCNLFSISTSFLNLLKFGLMIFTLLFVRSMLAFSSNPSNRIKEFRYNQIIITSKVPIEP